MSITPFIAGLVSLLLIPWGVLRPRLAILLLLVSLVSGQLIRFPLPGQGGGLLLSDLAIVLVLAAALWQLSVITADASSRPKGRKAGIQTLLIYRPLIVFAPFLAWSLSVLILHIPTLGLVSSVIAFSYWLRLVAIFLLVPALIILCQNRAVHRFLRSGLVAVIAILCLLGFFQLAFFPDLQTLISLGWDPHQGRLVSTWLDPNFFGGLLAVTLPWIVALSLQKRSYSLGMLAAVQVAALFFTQSRSSLLALILTGLCVTPVIVLWLLRRPHSAKVFSIISGAGIITVIFAGLIIGLGDRAVTAWRSDPTASLRLAGFKQTWPLVEKNIWLGVGYNAYQFAAEGAGIMNNYIIHSRSGADNSLLTIWVTTGIVGLILFLLPLSIAGLALLQTAIQGRSLPPAAIATGLLILFIHSQFVNSLLYSHLLIVIIIMVVLEFSEKDVIPTFVSPVITADASTLPMESSPKGRKDGQSIKDVMPGLTRHPEIL